MKLAIPVLAIITWGNSSHSVLGLQSSTTTCPQKSYYSRLENRRLHASTAVEATTGPTGSTTNDDEIDSVEFPPPLSQLDRLQRAAIFWSKALPIVANYYGLIGSLKLQEILGENLAEEKIEKLWDEKHEDGAQKLYETVADLKGFYVKTAQM